MKKILLILTLSLSFLSCKKEEITPNVTTVNQTTNSSTIKLNYTTTPTSLLRWIVVEYTNMDGVYYQYEFKDDGIIENVDWSKKFRIRAVCMTITIVNGIVVEEEPVDTHYKLYRNNVLINDTIAGYYEYNN